MTRYVCLGCGTELEGESRQETRFSAAQTLVQPGPPRSCSTPGCEHYVRPTRMAWFSASE